MKLINTFTVAPTLPPKLSPLREIAYNLFWAWDHEAIDLFRHLDRELWQETEHNPILMLANISQPQLDAAADDDAFVAHMNRVYSSFKEYMEGASTAWFQRTYCTGQNSCIAYFSAEFGITECMPIYSGGLGVLAGDHLKSASDLGVSLVGVGLLYQQGYFRQYLNADGWQQESYPENDFYNMAVKQERHEDGKPIIITVGYPEGPVMAQIWRAQVGRIALYLLDTNIADNQRLEDREITDQLYVADRERRLRQEIMLGIGGVRALETLDIQPMVYHMNEGHSAFLALERIRRLMQQHDLSFHEAKELVRATNVFTIHTPVAAGNEEFSMDIIEEYLKEHSAYLNISLEELKDLGRQKYGEENGHFNLSALALRLASKNNGVSALHGLVSRNMWSGMWPDIPENEVPIRAIVNGIHIRSWVSKDMTGLFDRYLGPAWGRNSSEPEMWERVKQIPDDELWRTHERRRERLVAFARDRLKSQLRNRGTLSSKIAAASEALDPEALTIGFARRFATYKRATLILRDLDRLEQILSNRDRPVQIIFAGKAHPRDTAGKELIQQVIRISQQDRFRRRIVFIEDYDICVARYLVQGADLWLNTPQRLMEASGTSGMKAAANGSINLSILDGWWHEAYNSDVGWAIGRDEDYEDAEYQNTIEANNIYEMLEGEIVPLFYDRGPDHIPHGWAARMKASMSALCPMFNTNRMVHEYIERAYKPCMEQWEYLTANDCAEAQKLAAWKAKIRQHWSEIKIDDVKMEEMREIKVGAEIAIEVRVYLGALEHDDVSVEIYQGEVDPQGNIIDAQSIRMNCLESHEHSIHIFTGAIPCDSSGLHGYGIRILPRYDGFDSPHELGLILWAS